MTLGIGVLLNTCSGVNLSLDYQTRLFHEDVEAHCGAEGIGRVLGFPSYLTKGLARAQSEFFANSATEPEVKLQCQSSRHTPCAVRPANYSCLDC